MEENTEHTEPSPRTPTWVPIVLGLQFLLAVIILGLSAYIIHGKYFNTLGFTIFASLLTWFVVVYHFTTLYASSLKGFRIPYAVMGVDAVMVIFWLSAMGASAALRASFKYKVTIDGCYNDGSLVNSSTCIVERGMEKRAAVATSTGLSIMSAIAGLSALEFLLFVACLVFNVLSWYKSRSQVSMTPYTPPKENEGYPMEAPQQAYTHNPQTVAPHEQYVAPSYGQQTYAPEVQGISTQPQTTHHPNLPAY